MLLSVACLTEQPPDSSLALALGVAVAEALEEFVVGPVQLKWPNDLLAGGEKLGGILVESASRQGGETQLVAGLGVNLRVTAKQRAVVYEEGGMPPAGLAEMSATRSLDRHQLAAAMIRAIAPVLELHHKEGFGPWQERWRQRDWLAGRQVQAVSRDQTHHGEASGVDASGALLIKGPMGEQRVLSAEIRL